MAIADVANGTLNTTAGGTPDTVVTNTTPGFFQFQANLLNIVNGDTGVIQLLSKVLTGDTLAIVYEMPFADAQIEKIKASPVHLSLHSVQVIIRQDTGASRAIPWTLIKA